jgi:hypothetical protein
MNKKELSYLRKKIMQNNWKTGKLKSRPSGVEKKPLKIGGRYNFLTIISFHHKKFVKSNKKGRTYFYYLCKCDCGKEKIILKESILSQMTKSCGCYCRKMNRFANRIKKGLASMHVIYNGYKQKCRLKHIIFDLSIEQFKYITSQKCHYCGTNPNQQMPFHKKTYYGAYKYNGIDRKNPKLGYTIKNSVSCCKRCNFAKSYFSINNFLKHVKKIYEYNKEYYEKFKK